mgnify:CR=1 FL=1
MDRTPIIKSCLEERKENLKQLQEKYSQLETDCEKAFIEEKMYEKLLERYGSGYTDTFSDKQKTYKEKRDAFEKEIASLKYEIKILEKEIEYLEELLN